MAKKIKGEDPEKMNETSPAEKKETDVAAKVTIAEKKGMFLS